MIMQLHTVCHLRGLTEVLGSEKVCGRSGVLPGGRIDNHARYIIALLNLDGPKVGWGFMLDPLSLIWRFEPFTALNTTQCIVVFVVVVVLGRLMDRGIA